MSQEHGDSVIDRLVAEATARRPGDEPFAAFVKIYLTGYPDFDIDPTGDAELFSSLARHYELGTWRAPGEIICDVHTPQIDRDGWESGFTYVYAVCDDHPFLVDTIRLALERFGVRTHRLIPPMLRVEREDGQMVDLGPAGTSDEDTSTDGLDEAWTQVQIDRVDADTSAALAEGVAVGIEQVTRAVAAYEPMKQRMAQLAEIDPLLGWLADDNFVFLGAATFAERDGELIEIEGSGLGDYQQSATSDSLADDPPLKQGLEGVNVERSMSVSTVHRGARMTVITVPRTAGDGDVTPGVVYERFRGLLSAGAYRASVLSVPTVGDRARAVMEIAGFDPGTHVGREIRNVLERLPRDVVFEIDQNTLCELVFGVVALQERQIVRVFEVPEPTGTVTTVLVYLPRDRYSSGVAEEIAELVSARLGSEHRDLETYVGTSSLARITFTLLHRPAGETAIGIADADRDDLREIGFEINELTTSWSERVNADYLRRSGTAAGSLSALGRVINAAPDEYRSAVDPAVAVSDLERLSALIDADQTTTTALSRERDAPSGQWRIRIYQRGEPLSLTELLPMLRHLGLNALEEHPYEFEIDGERLHVLDIGVELPAGVVMDDQRHADVLDTLDMLIAGEIEPDGFNRLVLQAGLSAGDIRILRAYAKYAHQTSFAFSQVYVEETLARLPAIASRLVSLFHARFDPSIGDDHGDVADRDAHCATIISEIYELLDAVPSLDDDRIARMFLDLILATVRTSAYSDRNPTIAFKFDPAATPELPEPRPAHEIFVTSPRVEGVHLRGGPIARGGIRWSDRLEDYRTEVLGLVKAQMVKNAVIVPVGAKGGFVVKTNTEQFSRDERRAEGQACYRLYVSSLLDVTDNLIDGEVVHPPDCVRYDGDDTYLVVAADKGTATFSDLANSVAAEYDFWLGDAFASGGSEGYDHKAMGITARGAWESAKRHGQYLGIDLHTDEFTVAGIGDMSGDVFGNGMLLSKSLKLVAAFNHLHIFLDPNPDPATSFAERQRLFALPGSTWADYNADLISDGGGVFSRSEKSIGVTPQVAEVLGLGGDIGDLTPTDLISAILRAPVTMLWNGGIGTYVKAASESDAQVGDRANDGVRVNGADLRSKMVVEGGNLGVTQLGRVEYALHGGLIYTDAIDNSAGVDTSDHEVNIKILLNAASAAGELAAGERSDLLESMTDEVADLVLDNNKAQTLALMIAREQAQPMVNVHARYLDALESEGMIDRAIEFLPTDKQIAERQLEGSGLRAPELAVLIAYTKNVNVVELLDSEVPDLSVLTGDVIEYFPTPLRSRFGGLIGQHRLHRQIAATQLINQMTNLSGISYTRRVVEDTGAGVGEIARAWLAAREVLRFDEWWNQVLAQEQLTIFHQIDLLLYCRQAAERSSLWFLRHRRPPIDIANAVEGFGAQMSDLLGGLRGCLKGSMARSTDRLSKKIESMDAPSDLAMRAALWPIVHTCFDVIEVSRRHEVTPVDAASVYWEIFDRLDLGWLWDGIGALPRSDRWQTQARAALRDDLMSVLAALADSVLEHTGDSVNAWRQSNIRSYQRTTALLTEIRRADAFNLTNLSVALRQLRNLATTSQRASVGS